VRSVRSGVIRTIANRRTPAEKLSLQGALQSGPSENVGAGHSVEAAENLVGEEASVPRGRVHDHRCRGPGPDLSCACASPCRLGVGGGHLRQRSLVSFGDQESSAERVQEDGGEIQEVRGDDFGGVRGESWEADKTARALKMRKLSRKK